MEFAKAGFHVIGYDVSERVVKLLMAGKSHIQDVPDADIAALVRNGSFEATTVEARLSEADAISIAVPTPLSKTRDPDMSYVIAAADAVTRQARPGVLVVLESTTYPGTTREVAAAGADESRAHRRRRRLRRVQPRARRPGQSDLSHEEHAEGRRRHHAGVHRARVGALRELHRHDRPGVAARKRRSW